MKYNHEPNSTLLGAYREPPLVVGVAGEMHYQVLLSNPQVQVGYTMPYWTRLLTCAF